MKRSRLHAAASGVCLALLAVACGAVDLDKVKPYSDFVEGPMTDLLDVATKENPYIGIPVRVAQTGLELADAAVDRHADWLETEIHLVDEKAARLREIKAEGGDLRGPEAMHIREYLWSKTYTLGNQPEGALDYTLDALRQHWGYAFVHVGTDKLIDWFGEKVLEKTGLQHRIERKLPLPQKVRWALDYGGPLAKTQRAIGWKRMDIRSNIAKKAVHDQMIEAETALAKAILTRGRSDELHKDAETAVEKIYLKQLEAHPSQTRFVMVPSSVRLVAAQAALPPPVAVAAAPQAAMIQPQQVHLVRAESTDGIAAAIAADNAIAFHYEDPTPQYRRTVSVDPDPPPQQETTDQPEQPSARERELHEELMRVGDGKTGWHCDNCGNTGSDSSWDGAKGQGLNDR